MGQRRFPRAEESRAAAQEARHGNGLVGRPERSLLHQPATRQDAGDGVKLGHLERLLSGHDGEDRRKPPGQHGLSRSGGPHHERVVPPGRRDLQGTPRHDLTPDLREVCVQMKRFGASLRGRPRGFGFPPSPQELDGRRQGRNGHHFQPFDQAGLGRVGFRHDDPGEARVGGRHGRREHAGRRHKLALQRELADEGVVTGRPRGHLGRCDQHTESEGKVEPRSILPHIGGGKIDNHTAERPFQAAPLDGRPDPLPSVLDARPRQAGQREGGQAPSHMRLDRDDVAANPDHGHAEHPPVHLGHRSPSHRQRLAGQALTRGDGFGTCRPKAEASASVRRRVRTGGPKPVHPARPTRWRHRTGHRVRSSARWPGTPRPGGAASAACAT